MESDPGTCTEGSARVTTFVTLDCKTGNRFLGKELASGESTVCQICLAFVDRAKQKVSQFHVYNIENRCDPEDENRNTVRDKESGSEQTVTSLESAVECIDNLLKSHTNVQLVTYGPWPLRQAIVREAQLRGLNLAPHWLSYVDVIQHCDELSTSVGSKLDNNNTGTSGDADCFSCDVMTNFNDDDDDCTEKETDSRDSSRCGNSNKICARCGFSVNSHLIGNRARIIAESHAAQPDRSQLASIEIRMSIKPKIWWHEDIVEPDRCVRTRGLPWQATDNDVANFFVGLNIAEGGIGLCISSLGRRNGEAIVLFEDSTNRDLALARHKHHIGCRYIEVYSASHEEFIAVVGGHTKEGQEFLSRNADAIIRMRGLPFNCTAKQIVEFFAECQGEAKDENCSPSESASNSTPTTSSIQQPSTAPVLGSETGVLFVKKPDGRASGDAFVLFPTLAIAEKAMLMDRQKIGMRYIELFLCTTSEVQQVLSQSVNKLPGRHPQTAVTSTNQSPLSSTRVAPSSIPDGILPSLPDLLTSQLHPSRDLEQQTEQERMLCSSGNLRSCIRLIGLPFDARVEHIVDFIGEPLSMGIVRGGVHMVVNGQGLPTGEAFIEMVNEAWAVSTVVQRYGHMLNLGGYKIVPVHLMQCSGLEMNAILSGQHQHQPQSVSIPLGLAQQSLLTAPIAPISRAELCGNTIPTSSTPLSVASSLAGKQVHVVQPLSQPTQIAVSHNVNPHAMTGPVGAQSQIPVFQSATPSSDIAGVQSLTASSNVVQQLLSLDPTTLASSLALLHQTQLMQQANATAAVASALAAQQLRTGLAANPAHSLLGAGISPLLSTPMIMPRMQTLPDVRLTTPSVVQGFPMVNVAHSMRPPIKRSFGTAFPNAGPSTLPSNSQTLDFNNALHGHATLYPSYPERIPSNSADRSPPTVSFASVTAKAEHVPTPTTSNTSYTADDNDKSDPDESSHSSNFKRSLSSSD